MLLCTKCQQLKAVAEFTLQPRIPRGYHHYCKSCFAAYSRTWRSRQPPEKLRASYRKSALKTRYGLTPDDLATMQHEQGGRCAICGSQVALAVDHCHATGVVRALLCGSCNGGLGLFRDSVSRLESAIAYLHEHAAPLTLSHKLAD